MPSNILSNQKCESWTSVVSGCKPELNLADWPNYGMYILQRSVEVHLYTCESKFEHVGKSEWQQSVRPIRIINKLCLFVVIIVVDVDDLHSFHCFVARSGWLQEFPGIFNDGIKFDIWKWLCWYGITTGGFAPSNITKPCLSHKLFASGDINSPRKWYCLAFARMGHIKGQCSGGNQNWCPFDLQVVKTTLQAVDSAYKSSSQPNPPVITWTGLSESCRPGTFTEPLIAPRWEAKVWRTKGLQKSPFHFWTGSISSQLGSCSVQNYKPFVLVVKVFV